MQLVQANTPAALAGLRFGDQILQINGKSCAGWSSDNAHKELKYANPEKITLAVRDRYTHTDDTEHLRRFEILCTMMLCAGFKYFAQ